INIELVSAEAELAAQRAALGEPKQPMLLKSVPNAVVAGEKVSPEKIEQYRNLSLQLDSFRKREIDYLTSGYAETSDFVKAVREQIAGLGARKSKLEEEYPQLAKLQLVSTNSGSPVASSGQIIDPSFETSRKVAAQEAKIRFLTQQLKEIRK